MIGRHRRLPLTGSILGISLLSLLPLTAGCAMAAPMHSEVAATPTDYSPDERIAEIDRLDFYIGDRMAELGIHRSLDSREETGAMSLPPDPGVVEHGTGTGDETTATSEPGPAEAPSPVHGDEEGVEAKRRFEFSGASRLDSAAASRCRRICDAAEAICIAADRICRIADSLPDHPTAGKRCTRARKDCEKAKEVAASCGCHFGG